MKQPNKRNCLNGYGIVMIAFFLGSCCKSTFNSAYLSLEFQGFSQNEINGVVLEGLDKHGNEVSVRYIKPGSSDELQVEFMDNKELPQVVIVVSDTLQVDTLRNVIAKRVDDKGGCPGSYDVEVALTHKGQYHDYGSTQTITIVK